jgi:hypothetical protein
LKTHIESSSSKRVSRPGEKSLLFTFSQIWRKKGYEQSGVRLSANAVIDGTATTNDRGKFNARNVNGLERFLDRDVDAL